jgi:ROS/MUCR transcriptional regulator protein
MADEPPAASLDRELTTNIVAAYVRKNQIASKQLGTLITTVHQALAALGKPAAEAETERTPAVPIRRSVQRDHLIWPRMRLAWPDAQTASHERTWIEHRPISCPLEPVA